LLQYCNGHSDNAAGAGCRTFPASYRANCGGFASRPGGRIYGSISVAVLQFLLRQTFGAYPLPGATSARNHHGQLLPGDILADAGSETLQNHAFSMGIAIFKRSKV